MAETGGIGSNVNGRLVPAAAMPVPPEHPAAPIEAQIDLSQAIGGIAQQIDALSSHTETTLDDAKNRLFSAEERLNDHERQGLHALGRVANVEQALQLHHNAITQIDARVTALAGTLGNRNLRYAAMEFASKMSGPGTSSKQLLEKAQEVLAFLTAGDNPVPVQAEAQQEQEPASGTQH